MIFNAVLPAQSAAGATSVTMAGVYYPQMESTDTVDAVYLTAPSTITGANTNFFTVNVRQMRNGASLGTFATQAFTSGIVASTEVPLSLTVASQPRLEQGDVVDVQLVQSGTGLAVPAGVQVAVVVS